MRMYHDSDGQSPASHGRCAVSIASGSTKDLWWQGDSISFDYSSPLLSVCSVPVLHIHLFVIHRRYIKLVWQSL